MRQLAQPLPSRPQRTRRSFTCASLKASSWTATSQLLRQRGVKGVAAAEAAQLARWPRSYALLDVRRADQFALWHATGAVNTPLFRLIEVRDAWSLLRKLSFDAQAVDPVEEDPDFLEALTRATAGKRGVVFIDGEGGSLETSSVRPNGTVSRSLLAAAALLSQTPFAGAVLHLEYGLNAWFAEGLPGEGSGEGWVPSGRTASAAQFAARQR